MIATLIVVCTIVVLLVSLWRLTIDSAVGLDALAAWEACNRKVNVDAFQLLVDPGEEAYLWKKVPTKEFRTLQRKRIMLALRSTRLMASNATLLMRVATMAARADNREISSAAYRLMFLSFRVRMNALLAEAYLLLKLAFPSWAVSVPLPLERYRRLLENWDAIFMRQYPRPTRTSVAG